MKKILLSVVLVAEVLTGTPTYSLPPNLEMGYENLAAIISNVRTNNQVTFASAHTGPQVAVIIV